MKVIIAGVLRFLDALLHLRTLLLDVSWAATLMKLFESLLASGSERAGTAPKYSTLILTCLNVASPTNRVLRDEIRKSICRHPLHLALLFQCSIQQDCPAFVIHG